MFIEADSVVSPLYPSSWASCLRFARLGSSPTNFIKSTMEVCQFNFCALFALSCVSWASRLPAEIAAPGAAAVGGRIEGELVGPPAGAEPCGAGAPPAAVAGVERSEEHTSE